jgi:hypothetical protein
MEGKDEKKEKTIKFLKNLKREIETETNYCKKIDKFKKICKEVRENCLVKTFKEDFELEEDIKSYDTLDSEKTLNFLSDKCLLSLEEETILGLEMGSEAKTVEAKVLDCVKLGIDNAEHIAKKLNLHIETVRNYLRNLELKKRIVFVKVGSRKFYRITEEIVM